jgi:hypothetical protein
VLSTRKDSAAAKRAPRGAAHLLRLFPRPATNKTRGVTRNVTRALDGTQTAAKPPNSVANGPDATGRNRMQREFKKCNALLRGSSGRRENIVARHPSILRQGNVVHHAATENRRELRAKRLFHSEPGVEAKPELRNEANSALCFQQKPGTEANSRQTYPAVGRP